MKTVHEFGKAFDCRDFIEGLFPKPPKTYAAGFFQRLFCDHEFEILKELYLNSTGSHLLRCKRCAKLKMDLVA